ncbi:MAG: PulJ/GspJ family protein, partial [Tepidimonas sp.]|uniref:PulJ/GspJ family protein n=1 Tax=Tepidimonas sp. TaxID=2002775 RepID=UPI004054DAB0
MLAVGRRRGFTLIELLVALIVMTLLAVMGWRGIDAMLRNREGVERTSQTLLGWQTALAQWQADLDAWAGPAGDGDDASVPRWSAGAQTVRWLRHAAEG